MYHVPCYYLTLLFFVVVGLGVLGFLLYTCGLYPLPGTCDEVALRFAVGAGVAFDEAGYRA